MNVRNCEDKAQGGGGQCPGSHGWKGPQGPPSSITSCWRQSPCPALCTTPWLERPAQHPPPSPLPEPTSLPATMASRPLPKVALAARPEGYLVLCCSLRFWTRPNRRVRFPLLPPEGAVPGRSRRSRLGAQVGEAGTRQAGPSARAWRFLAPELGGGSLATKAWRPQPSVPSAGSLGPVWGGPTRPESHSFILPTCADARC